MRPPPKLPRDEYLRGHKERRDRVIVQVKAGRRYADIAAIFDISPARVSQIAQAEGIHKKPTAKRRSQSAAAPSITPKP